MTTTTTFRKPLSYLHEDHEKWEQDILFYKDELKVFVRRLEEIAKRNT